MLRVSISGAEARVLETELLTEGRVGLRCGFSFGPDWAGLRRVAVFEGAVTRDVLFTGDTALVPAECLAEAGAPLRVGVYGLSPDGKIAVPTVWADFGKVQPSAQPCGLEAGEPTPVLAAHILDAAQRAEELAQSVRDDADAGLFRGEQGPQGVPGPRGEDYVLTEQDKADIVDEAIRFVTQSQYDALTPQEQAEASWFIVDDQPAEPVSIQSIRQTQTSAEPEGVNELTVTRTDGQVSRFYVRNGSRGPAGGLDASDAVWGQVPMADGAGGWSWSELSTDAVPFTPLQFSAQQAAAFAQVITALQNQARSAAGTPVAVRLELGQDGAELFQALMFILFDEKIPLLVFPSTSTAIAMSALAGGDTVGGSFCLSGTDSSDAVWLYEFCLAVQGDENSGRLLLKCTATTATEISME